MSVQSPTQAKITAVASFPPEYFLESLAAREDGSLLIGVLSPHELWYIPPLDAHLMVEPEPVLLFTFSQCTMGIAEAESDVFYIATSPVDAYQSAARLGRSFTSHDSYLHRLDLRGWAAGTPVAAEAVLRFPEPATGLNGACVITPQVVLIADSFAGLVWRVDIPSGNGKVTARVWLKHDSMASDPDGPMPDQPGVNGVQYAAKTNYLYYTTTAQQLFMRVRVDPETHDPAGEPEFVAGGMMGDDFCIDEDAAVAYVATHRQNTIDRVSLEPSENSYVRHSIAGKPFTEQLIGPTNGVWGRGNDDYGQVAYFQGDGGTLAPPHGLAAQPATVFRIEL